jgi:hypothetical protein
MICRCLTGFAAGVLRLFLSRREKMFNFGVCDRSGSLDPTVLGSKGRMCDTYRSTSGIVSRVYGRCTVCLSVASVRGRVTSLIN